MRGRRVVTHASSTANDDWRSPREAGLTDAEIEEFRSSLRAYLSAFLDEYFREALDRTDLD